MGGSIMKHAHNFYPSHVAKILACEAGLLSDMETDYFCDSNTEMLDGRDKLIEFQQMSLVNTFEDCLIVYYGIDLSESQIKSLRIIYEVTPKLLTGTVFDEAMSRVEDERKSINPNMAVIAGSLHTAIDCIGKGKRKSA